MLECKLLPSTHQWWLSLNVAMCAIFLLMHTCHAGLPDSVEYDDSHPKEYSVSPFLVLDNGTQQSTFTFTTSSSFIQIEPQELTDYQIRNRRSVSLEFRTRIPHALLVYHGLRNRPDSIKKYELYVMLDQGQLKIKHKFGDFTTTLIVGKGLNRDQWHKVRVMIDPSERRISAIVDDVEKEMEIDGLAEHHLYGAYDVDLESIIFIGGLSEGDGNVGISYFANPLVGCLRNVILETSPLKTSTLEPLIPLVSGAYKNIDEHCYNKCWSRDSGCSRDSECINHYDHVECDCFDAKFKGDSCKDTSEIILTLNGYSYVTFAIYEWMDRVHSDSNRISMRFMTQLDDSILFYAAGEIPFHNHVAVSVFNNSLLVDIDFGDDEPIVVKFTTRVTDGKWHTLTILHEEIDIAVHLDKTVQKFTLTGPNRYLYIDPDVYLGGGGLNLKHRNGLKSFNNFVGCLEEAYFNTKSILFELRQHSHQAQHHGLMPPEFNNCNPEKTIPITIPFADSGFKVSNPNATELHLKFSFKTNETYATLAYSDVRTMIGEGFWELKFSPSALIFEYFPDKSQTQYTTPTQFEVNYKKRQNYWHTIELQIKGGHVSLTVDGQSSEQEISHLQQLSAVITLGTSVYKPNDGFLGCIRRVEIGGKFIDARTIVGSDDQIGDIALDNCQFMDPCNRPDVCEHGGICKVIDSNVTCDCRDSGYTGKHCHFAIFKRTCEELALLGYTESGVYKIDIDGNGPYPPTHVKCKFETGDTGETKTIVEHNLANETDVWGMNKSDFKLELSYREFTSEMLLSLISQSVQCSQHIKFDCFKAKLGLYQFTWFKSADPNAPKVVSIGDARRNTCPCYEADTCVKGEQCNCDSGEDKWLHDEGYFTAPDRLGITELSFIYPRDSSSDAKARITLGPLECVEANTQRYVVTFKTFGSYLEAPGWKSGDLAFSFRTTRSSGILLYQPLLHQQHNSFSVFLTNDHELTFRFVLNGRPQPTVTVRSQRSLSGGDWQQVWIDYDLHQVRFQINREHQMINLPDGQQFGPFEGIMYIAGAPARYLPEIHVKEGLIGCFRGLVMNNQVVDLYSYMKFHKADIVKDCSPSCDPNPCQNKGICQENWGSFSCQCSNPWAHTGTLCETDINNDGLTFLSQSSYIKRQSLGANIDPIMNILTSNIYLNLRTYDEEALVLYANDNLNNFVQLHIDAGNNVTFMWNDGHFIEKISVHQKRLNHGNPIQIAVRRNSSHTILHVNDKTGVSKSGVSLLKEYRENPWVNPILETFAPPRPFAPAAPYYQLFLGGFDNSAVKPINNTARSIPGMLGCLRGFKIGNEQIPISNMANQNDVLEGCKMVCDTKPCHNAGICMEDFTSRQYSCDCTFTSYYGPACKEERGATFQGESYIRRRFNNPADTVMEIETRFGFSSNFFNGKETVLLTVQIPGQNYSLLFAINAEGHLILMETGTNGVEGAKIKYQHFIDGSRHSVYYKRNSDETIFIVDQEEIHLSSLNTKKPKFQLIPNQNLNVGEIFVGGVNEAVPDLINYKRFKGCLSNIYVAVNKLELRTLDEYMGYLKKPADQLLDMDNVEGIKASTCGAFFAFKPPSVLIPKDLAPMENGNADWRVSIPKKTNIYLAKSEEPDQAGISFDMVALILGLFLGILVLSVLVYAYKLNKRYKRRKYFEDDDDDDYFSHRTSGQPVRYHDPTNTELKYVGYRQTNPDPVSISENNHAKSSSNRINGDITNAEAEEDLLQMDNGDEESSDTTSQNESEVGSQSGSSQFDNQNLDDKGVEDPVEESSSQPKLVDGDLSLKEEEEDENPNDKAKVKPKTNHIRPPNKGTISPIFVSESVRTYESSPIAIIGGARYQNLKRTSKDSLLSLD
ncbi:contactin-associated protein-like 5 isoform X2 [Folsomia candida]|uniref:contactin-associated protein-like 5 isoform X2 n=1 Tax=Folsomia candida TaxID=158441 RepID=UPI000B8F1531|nr:contactin-associated protein-like 5 isoform X2 [Folsomia candida]